VRVDVEWRPAHRPADAWQWLAKKFGAPPIEDYDAGLLWRNLVLLRCVSFVPFPTALFSENFWSRTAFILYTASFGGVATAKLFIWRHAMKANLLKANVDAALQSRIARRSLAAPLACVVAIGLSLISIFIAPFAFALIPVLARVLDPTTKKPNLDHRRRMRKRRLELGFLPRRRNGAAEMVKI
jgi:uncharacterized membrane protein